MIPNYKSASTKSEKSYILSIIVEKIRSRAGVGGFIKKDDNGQWYEVGDFLAREKVSQAFRDELSDKYKSSTAYKKKRREVEQTGQLFEEFLKINSPANNGLSPSFQQSFQASSSQKQNQGLVMPQPNKETSKTESLFGLLDRNLGQKGVQERFMFHPNMVPNEPSATFIEPIPVPSRQDNLVTNQAFSSLFLAATQSSSGMMPEDMSNQRDCPDLEPFPLMERGSVTQARMNNLDMAELLRLTAQQTRYEL